jgi:2,4-dienoyl-CoA reductase-like NADH-dependent reductase (Old Yellow Enzyme family)/thioredoxin reductase
MQRKFPNLCSPVEIGGLLLNHRMFAAPVGAPAITEDGCYMPASTAFYELRAKGGAAVVCCTEGIVLPNGKSHTRMLDMTQEFVIQGLTETSRAIRKYGAAASIELSHGGKYSDVDNLNRDDLQKRNLRFGPSAETLQNGAEVHEMTKDMIRETVCAFGAAAALSKRAGFDMVLVHGGHGWLIEQFLSPADNRRTDEYGGSLQNRARLLLEILESIRGAVGKHFPIELRISAEEYREGGYELSDMIEVAKLVEDKIDLLHVSTGSQEGGFDITHPSMFRDRGCNVRYAQAMKNHVRVPVATLGALSDPAMMEDIIATGKADVVEMARALLADPYLPEKVMTGREDDIMPCNRCFTCFSARIETKTRICAVNPEIGRETECLGAYPPAVPQNVVIAGGGPAGMRAAVTAAQRGHTVTLFEKEEELGGALRFERAIPFKQDFYDITRVLERRMRAAGVDIVTGTELTPALAESLAPDVLIIAVGAEPVIPRIPGVDGANVLSANGLSEEGVRLGDTVAILGGGLVGCEAAVHLALEGKAVTVIEMEDGVARDANAIHGRFLRDKMNELEIRQLTGTVGTAVTASGVCCIGRDDTEFTVPADTVVIAVGQRARTDTVKALHEAVPAVLIIGDCVKPKNVTDAMLQGHYAGLKIGTDVAYAQPAVTRQLRGLPPSASGKGRKTFSTRMTR